MIQFDWSLAASWAQAISNTVVLFLIYLQMRQVNAQMVQNDDQERFRRSWEFVKLYREELRESTNDFEPLLQNFEPAKTEPGSDVCLRLDSEFFKPRLHLFILLNQLVKNQEVEERVLFGYLEEDFNLFVEIGLTCYGLAEFRKKVISRIDMLITLWGSQIRSSQLLYKSSN
jgi:hypothetical protein